MIPAPYTALAVPRRNPLIKPNGMPLGVNPVTMPRGLLYCFPFADLSYTELLRGGQPVVQGTTQKFASCPLGMGMKTLVDNTSQIGYNLSWPSLSTPFSMEVVCWLNTALSAANFYEFMVSGDVATPASVGQGDFAIVNASTTKIQADIGANFSTGGGTNTANATAATVGYFHAVATWDLSTLTIYYQGISRSTVAVASPMPNANGTKFLYFGAVDGDSSPAAVFLLANLSTVCWTAAEVMRRFQDPFGFLNYEDDGLFVGNVAGGTAFSFPTAGWVYGPRGPVDQLQQVAARKSWVWNPQPPLDQLQLTGQQKAWVWNRQVPALVFGIAAAQKGWVWAKGIPVLSQPFIAAQRAWLWRGQAPTQQLQITGQQKAWSWAAQAPVLSLVVTAAQRSWTWAKGAPALSQSIIAAQAAWRWTGGSPAISGIVSTMREYLYWVFGW